MKKLTRETQGFGWGYELHSNDPPIQPKFTGTVKNVMEVRHAILKGLGKTECYRNLHEVWFLDGNIIKSVNGKELWNYPEVDFHALAYKQGRDSLDIECAEI